MIEIKNLTAEVDGKEILKGINLTVKKGEVHDGKSKKAQAESVVVLHLKECKPLILSNRNFKTIIRI